MEAFTDCYKFSPFEFIDDFFCVFPTISCPSIDMLVSVDYPIHLLDPSTWICGDGSMSQDVSIPPLIFPKLDMEVDQELSIFHLLKAYGEAIKEELLELAGVILTRLHEKRGPTGTTMERLSHYLIQQSDSTFEYLKHESFKNYPMSFHAFYEITPYGRFAHFVANASIRKSLPRDMESIHIIDFDVGDGIQWPPLLASFRPHQSVQITCINLEGDNRYQMTKERLISFSQTMGLKVRVDQMKLEELLLEKRRLKSIGAGEIEWLIFNCMVGLPHNGMSNKSQRIQVEEFITVAQELVASSNASGMLTYGTGSSILEPFSDGHLLHSHALFESLEWHFQPTLSLARTTMECLFVGACVSSCYGWLDESHIGSKFVGCKLSEQNLLETKKMVRREKLWGEGERKW